VTVGVDTLPDVGLVSAGQVAISHMGATPVHVPSAWQVLVAAPDKL
jgi:hypothetical protein